jgi:putative membrane protein
MKKSEPYDFREPRRQSYSAILFFIYRFFKIVVRQIWPILLAFLFGREQTKTIFLYIIIFISVIIFIFSVIAFFRYYFYLKDGELIVQKGVFQRSVTNIPFERIQTINFEQSILHQMFNVVKLEIDTAGSKGNEFSFAALDKNMASALREKILKGKSLIKAEEGFDAEEADPDRFQATAETLVMKLGITELLKLGLGQNHLRSFLLIIAFFSWIMQQLNEIGMDADEMMGDIDPETLFMGKVAVITLAILAIIVSLLISLIRTILRFYDFKLLRTSDGFKIQSGLLNRRQIAAKDHKIQIVSWSDNPLKRLIGIYDVHLKQASSVAVQNRKSIVIPGCEKDNLQKIKSYYFDEREWSDLISFGIHPKYIYRRFLYSGVIPFLILFAVLFYFTTLEWALVSIIWLPLIFLAIRIRHKKWQVSINRHLLYLKSGLFGNYHKTIKLYKIQNLSLDQSLYHRFNQLCNLTIYSASGKMTIPYLPLDLGQEFMDYLLYKIEVDHRHWM